MAIGDVVSAISAPNTILTFIPAIGVEICVTSYGTDNLGNLLILTDGVNSSNVNSTSQPGDSSNCKIFITNTNYIKITAIGAGRSSCFTGIQIK
jgi:hypothetical protein